MPRLLQLSVASTFRDGKPILEYFTIELGEVWYSPTSEMERQFRTNYAAISSSMVSLRRRSVLSKGYMPRGEPGVS